MALPPHTLNRQFIKDFTEAAAPCCALGLVRSGDTKTGFFAMKPERAVHTNVVKMGFGFGHRILASPDLKPLYEFIFKFIGIDQYSVLVSPSSPLAMMAIEKMIDERDYLLLILNPDQRTSVFRYDIGAGNLAGMREMLPMMQSERTPQSSYERAVRAFRKNPDPPEAKVLEWVCRDNPAYLDLEYDTADLAPAGKSL